MSILKGCPLFFSVTIAVFWILTLCSARMLDGMCGETKTAREQTRLELQCEQSARVMLEELPVFCNLVPR
jgi:hypothetical protein